MTTLSSSYQTLAVSAWWPFVMLSVLTGLGGAFIHPVMSYYLVEGLGVPTWYVGVYMVSVTVAGLCISQLMGVLADRGVSSRKLYTVANGGTILALCVYMLTEQFWFILAAGVGLMAWGNASIPQMLTLGRQWADQQQLDPTPFNAKLRAGISFAWMLGPPLAFASLPLFGFQGAFSAAIFMALIGIVFVIRLASPVASRTKAQAQEHSQTIPISFWCLTLAVVFGSMGNNLYTSSLALYTITELRLPHYTPGLLMGLVAGLEIPIMLLASRLSQRIGHAPVMLVAFACGAIFYTGAYFAHSLLQLLVLQLLNALFYGLFAGVGLTLLQSLLPQRVGFTSAVYSNAFKIGVMLGSTLMGLIAHWLGFQAPLLAAIACSLGAAVCVSLFLYLKS